MEIPLRFSVVRVAGVRAVGLLLLGTLLASCASTPRGFAPLGLDTPRVEFNQGRVTIELVDENGLVMPGYRVNFGWDEPNFFKTSAFTDRNGQVTFVGVPEVVEVSINHEGGLFEQTFRVSSQGRSDMRVMVDTMGGYTAKLQQEAERRRAAMARSR